MKKLLIPYVVVWSMITPLAHSNGAPWSLPGGFGAYPDVVATITGGNGTIARTGMQPNTAADCTGADLITFAFGGNSFGYTSGFTYRANLRFFFEGLDQYQNTAPSVRFVIVDTDNNIATTYLAYQCTSPTACTFTPNRITLAF